MIWKLRSSCVGLGIEGFGLGVMCLELKVWGLGLMV